ncbi:hypothetical protein [Bacteroides congonensis]|uniref:hypothetical protein n=1 Tax=Bacteroides congonensis TaxID=1871006 RepID=UPI00265DEC7A|nr:hypothetical protein [Bacteroides congonensis]
MKCSTSGLLTLTFFALSISDMSAVSSLWKRNSWSSMSVSTRLPGAMPPVAPATVLTVVA